LFRFRADWRQWRFALAFLVECLPSRWTRNTIQCLASRSTSRDCLKALRAETGIQYDQLERGILELHTGARANSSTPPGRPKRCGQYRLRSRRERMSTNVSHSSRRYASVATAWPAAIYTASDESAMRISSPSRSRGSQPSARRERFRFGVSIDAIVGRRDTIASVSHIRRLKTR
jgi:D-amino-acid dehydrogenase